MQKQFNQSLGEYLRGCRRKRSLSLRALCERTHYDTTYLSKIENDHFVPSVGVLDAYIQHCEANSDWVYLHTNRVPPDMLAIFKTNPGELQKVRERVKAAAA